MPSLVTYLYHAPICEWYLIKFGFKNKYKKDICLGEIGLRARNMLTILSSKVKISICVCVFVCRGGGEEVI